MTDDERMIWAAAYALALSKHTMPIPHDAHAAAMEANRAVHLLREAVAMKGPIDTGTGIMVTPYDEGGVMVEKP